MKPSFLEEQEALGEYFARVPGSRWDATEVAEREFVSELACTIRARLRDWQFDGLTAHDNLAHLCPACHALKSETGWRVLHLGDGTLKWTSPTGRTFVSEPATVIRPVSTEPSPAPPARDTESEAEAEPAPF